MKQYQIIQRQSGFTLIELMIAVAIVGILATVALPAYQDYTVRAKVSELLMAASGAKLSVVEYVDSTGKLAGSGANLTIPTDGKYISATGTGVSTDGNITVAGENMGPGVVVSLNLEPTLHSSGLVTWKCTSSSEARYLPPSCRGTPSSP